MDDGGAKSYDLRGVESLSLEDDDQRCVYGTDVQTPTYLPAIAGGNTPGVG